MRCEVCGRKIIGEPLKAIIEGAKMVVCAECSKLSKVKWEIEEIPSKPRTVKATRLPTPTPVVAAKKQVPQVSETLDLIDNFSSQLRQAREKMGLSLEDLGRKISERVSVLKKIENGKMTPTYQLAERLEHTLKIKLFVPLKEPKIPSSAISMKHTEITLGDLINVKKKTEEREERKPS
jgi:putative transcription factor